MEVKREAKLLVLIVGAVIAALTATMGVRLAAHFKIDRLAGGGGSRRRKDDMPLRSKRQRKQGYRKVNHESPAVVSAVDDMESPIDEDEEEFDRAPVDEARDDYARDDYVDEDDVEDGGSAGDGREIEEEEYDDRGPAPLRWQEEG